MSWSEWDGRGFDEAEAWSFGIWSEDSEEVIKQLRQLGLDVRSRENIELTHGYVGTVEGDVVYDACYADGTTREDPDVTVDTGTLEKVSFAQIVDKE